MPDSTDISARLADSLTATTVWQQEMLTKLLFRDTDETTHGLDIALILHNLHAQVADLSAQKVAAERRATDLHAALHDACEQRDAYKTHQCPHESPWLVTVDASAPTADSINAVNDSGSAAGSDRSSTDAGSAMADIEAIVQLLPNKLLKDTRYAANAALTAIGMCRESFENGNDEKAFTCMRHAATHMENVIAGLKTITSIATGEAQS
nr:MAG TPA: hypothetical protein [Caudoviricetes sp.]